MKRLFLLLPFFTSLLSAYELHVQFIGGLSRCSGSRCVNPNKHFKAVLKGNDHTFLQGDGIIGGWKYKEVGGYVYVTRDLVGVDYRYAIMASVFREKDAVHGFHPVADPRDVKNQVIYNVSYGETTALFYSVERIDLISSVTINAKQPVPCKVKSPKSINFEPGPGRCELTVCWDSTISGSKLSIWDKVRFYPNHIWIDRLEYPLPPEKIGKDWDLPPFTRSAQSKGSIVLELQKNPKGSVASLFQRYETFPYSGTEIRFTDEFPEGKSSCY